MQITSLFPRARAAGSRTPDDGADAVRVLNQAYLDAVRTNDAAWFDRYLAEDVVIVLGGGRRLGKAQYLAMLREEPNRFRNLGLRDVRVRGFGAVMQVDADAPWEQADGTRGVSRYIDTWAWLDGRWQVISAQITLVPDTGPTS